MHRLLQVSILTDFSYLGICEMEFCLPNLGVVDMGVQKECRKFTRDVFPRWPSFLALH